jgi:ATP-binding cassette, subfamily D (ALD), peroxisomal long-chain fatty acid import protein
MPVSSNKHFKDRIAQLSKTYAIHRPLIQRCLNAALIFYSLGSTYRGLTSRSRNPSSSRKSVGKTNDDETQTVKPPRVAVSQLVVFFLVLIPSITAR